MAGKNSLRKSGIEVTPPVTPTGRFTICRMCSISRGLRKVRQSRALTKVIAKEEASTCRDERHKDLRPLTCQSSCPPAG